MSKTLAKRFLFFVFLKVENNRISGSFPAVSGKEQPAGQISKEENLNGTDHVV